VKQGVGIRCSRVAGVVDLCLRDLSNWFMVNIVPNLPGWADHHARFRENSEMHFLYGGPWDTP